MCPLVVFLILSKSPSLAKRGAWALFHGVWTFGVKVMDF